MTICRLHSRRRNRNPSRCGHDPQGGARPAVGNQRSMAADNAAAWPRDAEIPLTDVRSVPKTGLARPPPNQQTARKGRLNFLYAQHRPGRCDPPRHRPRAGRVRREPEARTAQGRFHDPRCARSRAQEGRPAQGASRHAVLEALTDLLRPFLGPGVVEPSLLGCTNPSAGAARSASREGLGDRLMVGLQTLTLRV